jgi:hypothetical protein
MQYYVLTQHNTFLVKKLLRRILKSVDAKDVIGTNASFMDSLTWVACPAVSRQSLFIANRFQAHRVPLALTRRRTVVTFFNPATRSLAACQHLFRITRRTFAYQQIKSDMHATQLLTFAQAAATWRDSSLAGLEFEGFIDGT